MENPFEDPDEFRKFLKDVSNAAAHADIYRSGVRYVDDVEFWRFLTGEVVKAPQVNGSRLPLTNAEAIQGWVNQRVAEDKGHYVQHVLQNRGAEFDFVKEKQDSWLETLKGRFWRRATPIEDFNGIDAVSRSPLTGSTQTHQIKAGTSDAFRKVDLGKYIDGSSAVDQVHVNEKIHNWRNSPEGRATIAQRGDDHPFVEKSFSDDQLVARGEQRMDTARTGQASPRITLGGAVNQIGNGALMGTVVSVSVSTLVNYQRYQSGEISGEKFGELILADGAYGGVMGGSVAAVNIPVQVAAHAIGAGAPITIPVMIVFSATMKKLVDPIFQRGEYAEVVNEMEVSTNIGLSAARFSQACCTAFDNQPTFLRAVEVMEERGAILDAVSNHTDDVLEAMTKRIEAKGNEHRLGTNQQSRRRRTQQRRGGDV